MVVEVVVDPVLDHGTSAHVDDPSVNHFLVTSAGNDTGVGPLILDTDNPVKRWIRQMWTTYKALTGQVDKGVDAKITKRVQGKVSRRSKPLDAVLQQDGPWSRQHNPGLLGSEILVMMEHQRWRIQLHKPGILGSR